MYDEELVAKNEEITKKVDKLDMQTLRLRMIERLIKDEIERRTIGIVPR